MTLRGYEVTGEQKGFLLRSCQGTGSLHVTISAALGFGFLFLFYVDREVLTNVIKRKKMKEDKN